MDAIGAVIDTRDQVHSLAAGLPICVIRRAKHIFPGLTGELQVRIPITVVGIRRRTVNADVRVANDPDALGMDIEEGQFVMTFPVILFLYLFYDLNLGVNVSGGIA